MRERQRIVIKRALLEGMTAGRHSESTVREKEAKSHKDSTVIERETVERCKDSTVREKRAENNSEKLT